MIIDAFIFNNELDLLEVRLNTLASVVGRFVLVEAPVTYMGTRKPLHFADNRERFKGFPITHVIVDDMPSTNVAWNREFYQRHAMVRGLDNTQPDDIIMTSDVDEIPDPKVVASATPAIGELLAVVQRFYYYRFHWLIRGTWKGTRICNAVDLMRWGPQTIRHRASRMVRGGWHFSHFSTPEEIELKIRTASHQEYNHEPFNTREWAAECIRLGRDMFNRPEMQMVRVDGFHHLPDYVGKNASKLAHLL